MRRITCAFLMLLAAAVSALADPPERVGRIAFISGTASFRTADAPEWSPATLNYPVTIGDHLWTDRNGRIEIEMGATAVALDATTAVSVLNLDHQIVQLRLVQGSAIVRVRDRANDESIEIDTPNGATTVLGAGVYRIDVSPNGDTTTVTVRRGDAEVAAGASLLPVRTGDRVALEGVDAQPTRVANAALDDFDDWAMFRDRRADAPASARYVPRAVVGYEDLDEFGTWRVVADYGPVWVPRVRAGWAPYRFGHWAWVDPWGWTWIDDAPWGFAPFHYGRWAYVGGGWGWVPGGVVVRPVYAPALVAFVGGAGWRVNAGIGEPIGWFPLGPREVFVPAYAVSPVYVVAVNRPHVAVANVNVNVTNITYVNRTAPGAVTVVSRETFVRARPVAAAAVAVSAQSISGAVVVGHTAPREVAPAAVPRPVAAAQPPAAVVNRSVVVRTAPSPAARETQVRRSGAPTSAPAPANAPVQAPAARPAPSPAPRPDRSPAAPQPAPPAANSQPAPRPAPANADIAARHTRERADVQARHASERAALQARHEAEVRAAPNAQARADIRARHQRERAELDVRQKHEREQMQARQESERRRQ